MQYDAIGLLVKGANALSRHDKGSAYALFELANNLRVLMRGEATLKQWNDIYVGADRDPIDIDKALRVR